MQHEPTPRGPVRSVPTPLEAHRVATTVHALERLAEHPLSAPELAEILRLDVRSVRRVLKRLALEGFLVQDDGHRRRYRPTLRLAALGSQVLVRHALPELARPVLAELAADGRATAHLWVAAGNSPVSITREATEARVHAGVGSFDGVPHADSATRFVLDARLRWSRPSAYFAGPSGACTASIADRGSVVAALGLTGLVDVTDLARVMLAARTLSRRLDTLHAASSLTPERGPH